MTSGQTTKAGRISKVRNKRIPKVRIVRPAGRPFQVRYREPETQREVRISVRSRNELEAKQLKQDVEAKLRLGLDPSPRVLSRNASMCWEDFRDEYSRLKLATLRESTAEITENQLDVCQTIIKPRTLADMAKPTNLERLKAELLIGTASQRKRPRSPHTVNSYLSALVAALNWGHKQRWLKHRVGQQKVAADDPSKGRPLCTEEFERMLEACKLVCGKDQDAWKYLLWGLWESGLRVSEAMNLSFDIPGTIQVVRERRGMVLEIPGKRQKNRKLQTIPTIPSFVELLAKHPTQSGWVFTPRKLNHRGGRITAKQVARVITKIGEKAKIVVNENQKPASAHDLRRSFGQRLADAGVSPRDLQKIMRHRSMTTTEQYYLKDDVFAIGDRLAARFGKPKSGYTYGYSSQNEGAGNRSPK